MNKIVDILSSPTFMQADTHFEREPSVQTWKDFCMLSGIAEGFYDCKLSDVKDLHLPIYNQIIEWAKRNPRPNLILHGGVGSGKTHTAFAVLRALWENGNKWCRYITSQQIIECGETKGISYLKQVYGEPTFLVVDDLGTEKAAEWQTKYYFELFDFRYNRKLPTIITSNFNLDGITKMLTQRISSRLSGVQIQFPNEDLRGLM